MIHVTKILFEDQTSKDLGLEQEFLWFDGSINLKKISSWHDFVWDNKRHPHTEVFFDNGRSLVIQEKYSLFSTIMDGKL
jgi:hypothetical protein